MKKLAIFLFLFFLSCSSARAGLNQMIDVNTQKIFSAEIKSLFNSGKYDELEKKAKEFRAKKSRFDDGLFKLPYFYIALASPEEKSDKNYEKLFSNVKQWSKKFPGSITQKIAEGTIWIEYAWFARGSGYTDTVSEQNWNVFYERIQKAYDILSKPLKSKKDDCPERYYALLIIAKAQGWDRSRYERLFSEAVAFEPAYHRYYTEKASYLAPRWYGEKGEWQKFAEEAVKLTPPGEGMSIYTRILWSMWNLGEWKDFKEAGISWQKMKQGFFDIKKNYPNSRWNLNKFANFALYANDRETMKALFAEIGDNPYPEAWLNPKIYSQIRPLVMEKNLAQPK